MRTRIPAEEASLRAGGFPTNIEVAYVGFPAAHEAAFQYAVNLWAASFVADFPIRIEATYAPLGAGTLGRCSPVLVSGFAGQPAPNVFYPIAFANQFANCDLDPAGADMQIVINSTAAWYTGTDANPGIGQYDLVSVVLHELGHGFGFVSSAQVDDGVAPNECAGGTPGAGCFGALPFYFDTFIEDVLGQRLTNPAAYTPASVGLGGAMVSGNLYWDGPNAVAANGGLRPRLYAPTPFAAGSSIAHLDEAAYPAGDARSLMTPALGLAEAIHVPGAVLLAMFEDMGWTLADAPAANFNARSVAYVGYPHSFSDCSALATSWAWDFDNNGTTDAAVQSPIHTYPAAGNYTARLTINGNPALTYTKAIQVADTLTIPYENDFEAGNGGFYASDETCTAWEYGLPAGFVINLFGTMQGPNAWVTDLGGQHGTNTEYYLESPPMYFIGAVGNYYLEFGLTWAAAGDAGMNVQYSTDGGLTWQVLGGLQGTDPNANANWYNTASVPALGGQPGWQAPIFVPSSNAPALASYQITSLAPNADVRFRFHFGGGAVPGEGVAMDLFRISGAVLAAEDIALEARTGRQGVALSWLDDAAASTRGYAIERSREGNAFAELGRTGPGEAEFMDRAAPQGLSRYRIKRLKGDGGEDYSHVAEVSLAASAGEIFPNPFTDEIHVSAPLAPGYLHLYSTDGRLVYAAALVPGQPHVAKVAELPPGAYIYVWADGAGIRRGLLSKR
jgi:hypothetical protein